MTLKVPSKSIKRKSKLIVLILCLCITISTVLIYSIINNISNNKVISSTVIAEKLSKISELSTMKYTYSNVIALKDSKKFKDFSIPFTEKSFLVKYSGYIKAGVDLKDLDINTTEKEVTITLKKAKIFDHVINNEDLFVYDEKSSMFNKLSMQDMVNEITNEKSKVEAELIKSGFLEEANANTKLILEGFLGDMGFSKVNIIFK